MLKIFQSAKAAIASSASRTKRIPQKRVKGAFAKKMSKCLQLVDRDVQTFLSHRLEEMKSKGPFYLAVIERPKYQVWYKRQRMVIHSINSFTKTIVVQAEIKGKRPTNHSVRKTLLKKLKAINQPRFAIIGV